MRASLSDAVAEEAVRVNAIDKNALHNASQRLQSESREIQNLRTEYQGRQVHSSLILQSEVNAVQNNADRALSDQQNSYTNASKLYQQSEQAQIGRMRSEFQEHLASTQQQGQLLLQTQHLLQLEQEKCAQVHIQLVDCQAKINSADMQLSQIQSELAIRDSTIQSLNQQLAGREPLQQQIDAAVQLASQAIMRENQQNTETLNSKWTQHCEQAQLEAERNTKRIYQTEMQDIQNQLQKFYDKETDAPSGATEPNGAEHIVLSQSDSPKKPSESSAEAEKGQLNQPNLAFGKWPTPHNFPRWRRTWRRVISHAARDPNHAYQWIGKVQKVKSWEELADTEEYPRLDSKICSTILPMFEGEVEREVRLAEVKNEKATGLLLNGRQYCWLMYDIFDRSALEGAICNIDDLMNCELHGQNLKQFNNTWEEILESLSNNPELIPAPPVLETLYLKQLRKFDPLRLQLDRYDDDVLMNNQPKDYEKLKKMVKVFLAQKKLKNNKNKDKTWHI